MDHPIAEGLVRRWISARSPGEEGAGGSGHLARTWAQLDALEAVAEEGEALRITFLWSEHRESEFTVYTEEGDESLLQRTRSVLLLSPAGEVLEEAHETLEGGFVI